MILTVSLREHNPDNFCQLITITYYNLLSLITLLAIREQSEMTATRFSFYIFHPRSIRKRVAYNREYKKNEKKIRRDLPDKNVTLHSSCKALIITDPLCSIFKPREKKRKSSIRYARTSTRKLFASKDKCASSLSRFHFNPAGTESQQQSSHYSVRCNSR